MSDVTYDMYSLDEGKQKRIVSGMGLFLSVGRKTQKVPTKCVYTAYCILRSYVRAVYPAAEICARLAISVRSWQQWHLWQIIWFGWLSAIWQLASRGGGGEGEWGNRSPYHFTTWLRWQDQGEGLHSLSLAVSRNSGLVEILPIIKD